MPGDGERTHLAGSVVPGLIVICGVHALGQSARGRLCGASPPSPAAAFPSELRRMRGRRAEARGWLVQRWGYVRCSLRNSRA
jgi:hypothetical protein